MPFPYRHRLVTGWGERLCHGGFVGWQPTDGICEEYGRGAARADGQSARLTAREVSMPVNFLGY
jgi:hypothetical protein